MAIVEIPSVTYTPLDFVELRHKRRESALTQLAAAARRHGVVRDVDALFALLVRRERLGTTALGKGVALSHARLGYHLPVFGLHTVLLAGKAV